MAPTEVASPENGPTSRMTAAATQQGFKNAAHCAVPLFAVSGFVFWSLNTFTALPWRIALFSAFMIPFAVCLFVMIANWIQGMQLRGELIIDCGPHPGRRLFLINAIMFLALGFSGFAFGAAVQIFMTLFAAYWAFMAAGRFSVHSTGLWVYHTLLPWKKISYHCWTPDNTLILQTTGFFSWSRSAIPVPAECVDDVKRLLREHKTQVT